MNDEELVYSTILEMLREDEDDGKLDRGWRGGCAGAYLSTTYWGRYVAPRQVQYPL
jgi:hypothetical protein